MSSGGAVQVHEDLVYAVVDGVELALDLYRPAATARCPVVVYLHGGGWALGHRRDRARQRAHVLAGAGIAVATVSYRLTGRAAYPAQLHDAKAAVRWIRANGEKLGLRTAQVGAWGASAGGHLAALLGVTSGVEWSGAVGEHLDESDAVDAVVAWFAPLDLAAMLGRTPLEADVLPPPREHELLGTSTPTPEAVAQASPAAQVTRYAAPFMLMHGDRDRMVPLEQSERMHRALVAAGVPCTLVTLGGAGHEDSLFEHPRRIEAIAAFMRDELGGGR